MENEADVQASELIESCVHALVYSPADEATEILKGLSVEKELLDWQEYLDVACIQRQASLRCARYQIPSIEALAQTLN